ncbi:MAG: DUF465 domain-containing protein [Pseudomonadota bacterium]
MNDDIATELHDRLAALRREHRALDEEISALAEAPQADLFQIQRLKRRKLQMKDEIVRIESMILPDIIA